MCICRSKGATYLQEKLIWKASSILERYFIQPNHCEKASGDNTFGLKSESTGAIKSPDAADILKKNDIFSKGFL